MSALSAQFLLSLFTQCATDVAPQTLQTLIGVESGKNPYAIAVVYDDNTRPTDKLIFSQPDTEEDAKKIITQLETPPKKHRSYSVGLMQINSTNFEKYGLTRDNMFNVCKNIEAGAAIFKACYIDAQRKYPTQSEQEQLRLASSCYYAGNHLRGFKKEQDGKSYIDRINESVAGVYKVPAIKPLRGEPDLTSPTVQTIPPSEQSNPAPQTPHVTKEAKAWDMFGDFNQ